LQQRVKGFKESDVPSNFDELMAFIKYYKDIFHKQIPQNAIPGTYVLTGSEVFKAKFKADHSMGRAGISAISTFEQFDDVMAAAQGNDGLLHFIANNVALDVITFVETNAEVSADELAQRRIDLVVKIYQFITKILQRSDLMKALVPEWQQQAYFSPEFVMAAKVVFKSAQNTKLRYTLLRLTQDVDMVAEMIGVAKILSDDTHGLTIDSFPVRQFYDMSLSSQNEVFEALFVTTVTVLHQRGIVFDVKQWDLRELSSSALEGLLLMLSDKQRLIILDVLLARDVKEYGFLFEENDFARLFQSKQFRGESRTRLDFMKNLMGGSKEVVKITGKDNSYATQVTPRNEQACQWFANNASMLELLSLAMGQAWSDVHTMSKVVSSSNKLWGIFKREVVENFNLPQLQALLSKDVPHNIQRIALKALSGKLESLLKIDASIDTATDLVSYEGLPKNSPITFALAPQILASNAGGKYTQWIKDNLSQLDTMHAALNLWHLEKSSINAVGDLGDTTELKLAAVVLSDVTERLNRLSAFSIGNVLGVDFKTMSNYYGTSYSADALLNESISLFDKVLKALSSKVDINERGAINKVIAEVETDKVQGPLSAEKLLGHMRSIFDSLFSLHLLKSTNSAASEAALRTLSYLTYLSFVLNAKLAPLLSIDLPSAPSLDVFLERKVPVVIAPAPSAPPAPDTLPAQKLHAGSSVSYYPAAGENQNAGLTQEGQVAVPALESEGEPVSSSSGASAIGKSGMNV
jgi:hypothetical protein